jgi:hypothetical protein
MVARKGTQDKRIYTKQENELILSGNYTRAELIKMFDTTLYKFDRHVKELKSLGHKIKYKILRRSKDMILQEKADKEKQERKQRLNTKLPIRYSDFLKPLTKDKLMAGR